MNILSESEHPPTLPAQEEEEKHVALQPAVSGVELIKAGADKSEAGGRPRRGRRHDPGQRYN